MTNVVLLTFVRTIGVCPKELTHPGAWEGNGGQPNKEKKRSTNALMNT